CLLLARGGRLRDPRGEAASGGVRTGHLSYGPRARRADRGGRSGGGSSCLGTRGRTEDCSLRWRPVLGGRKFPEGEGDHGGGQGQQHRGQGERRGGGKEQMPSGASQWLAGAQEPVDPLDRVGGPRGEGRRGTGGAGEDDQ